MVKGDDARRPAEFRDARCDPEEETDWIRNDAAAALRKRVDKSVSTIPPFEAGHYRDASGTIGFQSAAVVEPMEALELLMEAAGLPMRFRSVGFVGAASRDAAELAFEPTFRWYVWLLRALGSPFDSLFGRYFGRIAIAQLPSQVALALSQRVWAAILYWREKIAKSAADNNRTFAVDVLRLYLEVLARLTVHQDPSAARASLDLATDLARDMSISHFWLYEPLDHLANCSIQAIPPADRTTVVLPMLEFPLSTDRGSHPFRWPNPILSLWTNDPGRAMRDTRWSQCVAHLIEAASPASPQRAEAVTRLAYLAKHNALSSDEADAFGSALWAEVDEAGTGLPTRTALLAFAFAELPAPAAIDKENLVRACLFDSDIRGVLSPPVPLGSRDIDNKLRHLQAISGSGQRAIWPTREQAARLFDGIVRWRPPVSDPVDLMRASLLRPLRDNARRVLGEVLRNTVVASLDPEDRTTDRARELLRFIREVPGSTAVGALPYFLSLHDEMNAEIIGAVQQAISGRTDEEVAGGAWAVEQWQALDSIALPLPAQLADRVVSAIESGREIGMIIILRCARKLVSAGTLSEPQLSQIANALGDQLIEQEYGRVDPDSRQSVSVSLIRAECVRLARALDDAGIRNGHTAVWLTAAPADPLPEVRFALATGESD